MTTKTISSYYATGYTLSPSYAELDITATGRVGGFGVYSNHFATVSNVGTIDATSGPGHGVYLQDGGAVLNGSYAALDATIVGGSIHLTGGFGTVTNFGTITSFVIMIDGGIVTNGGVEDATALINDGGGVYLTGALPGTVNNFGTIQAYGQVGYNGVNLGYGGRVTNGAVTDTVARIEGFTAVLFSGPGTVTNFGTIHGAGAAHGAYGVVLGAGGRVTNGTAIDAGALIEGYTGVVFGAAGTVANFGTIRGLSFSQGESGVYLKAGGTVTNGGVADRTATIEGYIGVLMRGSGGVIHNSATILGVGSTFGYGVFLGNGTLYNGSLNNGAALIEGDVGAALLGSSVATNFGTVAGIGDFGSFGVVMNGTASLTNGAAGRARATVEGYGGVRAVGTANTVTNFGTIEAAAGFAVYFGNVGSNSDVLVVEAGCAFYGAVSGGGGTLDLASGVGTLTGLLSSGGNVTVSGSMAATTFQRFNTVEIGAGATFTSTGAVTLAAGQTVNDAGTLTLGGAGKASIVNAGLIETTGGGLVTLAGTVKNNGALAVNSGTMTVTGAVTGTGQATVKGGTLDFASTFNEAVTFSGTTGVLELSHSQSYTAAITGFSKTGKTSLDLVDIGFVSSTEATFSGTTTSGVLTVTDGTHTAKITLMGNYTTSTFVASSDGHGGVKVIDPQASPAAAPAHQFIAAMAGLGGSPASALHIGEAWVPHGPVLARPRVMAA